MIRSVDVLIGDFYSARCGGGPEIVKIHERVASCCWLATNTATGRDRYVVLADLVAKVDPPQPSAEVIAEASKPQADADDHVRRWWLDQ